MQNNVAKNPAKLLSENYENFIELLIVIFLVLKVMNSSIALLMYFL